MKKFIGVLSAAFIGLLALAGTASADVVTPDLSSFAIFAGGGGLALDLNDEFYLGGHSEVTGNIGSNQDLTTNGGPLPGYPAQINGSVYVGGYLLTTNYTIGTSGDPQEIVVNGAGSTTTQGKAEADLGGLLYGDLYVTSTLNGLVVDLQGPLSSDLNDSSPDSEGVVGNVEINSPDPDGLNDAISPTDQTYVSGSVALANPTRTFGLITMPAAMDLSGFTKITDPDRDNTDGLIAPNTLGTAYGTLGTTSTGQTINLQSGDYYFEEIVFQGDTILQIDLSSGDPINIYVFNDMNLFGSDISLWVKGAGTGGVFLEINNPSAQALASLIYMETQGDFTKGGEQDGSSSWGGTVYASSRTTGEGNISIGQYIDWFGAAWAFDSFNALDHGTWHRVPLDGEVPIPEPATMLLLGTGLIGVAGAARRRKKNQA